MADILLKRSGNLAATYVPNTFIDEYMTHADGEFVKIYLYLLRCMDNNDIVFSISDTADKFDHTEKDVTRALKYWEKMQLLRLEFNSQKELTGICLADYAALAQAPCANQSTPHASQDKKTDGFAHSNAAQPGNNAGYPTPSAIRPQAPAGRTGTGSHIPERTEYTKNELLQFTEDETVKELIYVAERYLGHPLNSADIQTILYWLDKLGFSQDLIDYLIEQCVAKSHTSIRYMDKIALSWAGEGIHTLSQAKQSSGIYSSTVRAVQKAFGISNRCLANPELEFVKKWSDEMGFSDELIALACEKTILSIHQISFDYADSILGSWVKQNAHTLNDIKLLDAQYQETKSRRISMGKTSVSRTSKGASANSFANFSQRTYNYEELERELLSHA